MIQWLKTTWYFFLILGIAQIAKTSLHIFLPNWNDKLIYLSYNLVLIVTSFFISWFVYKQYESIVKSVLSALALVLFSSIGMNIITALVIVKIYYPALFEKALTQMPIAFQNGLIYLPMVILLAFIACRTADRRENLKGGPQ